jgi:hypothetical protein
MRYSPFLAVIAIPLLLFAASPTTAGPITYNIVDYSAQGLQNNFFGDPVLISGTITTYGTTGLGITDPKVITGWTVTFTQGLTSHTILSTDPGAFVTLAGGDRH